MQLRIEEFFQKNLINFYFSQLICEKNDNIIVMDNITHYENDFLNDIKNMPEVDRCLIVNHLISIKYIDETNVNNLKTLIMCLAEDAFAENKLPLKQINKAENLTSIEAIADAFIRPTLFRDSGDIVIHSYQDGIIEVQFIGHCAGCPHAQNTLNNVISKRFKQYLSFVKQIIMRD